MSDFVRLYQRADVVQLADSIEFLRRSVRRQFNVEPLHSISAPGFSFNCFINKASDDYNKNHPDAPPFEISTLSYEQLEFFSQIRGGISTAIKRHAHKDDGELVYYDANSLYPSAMRSYMPYSNFEIMTTPPTLDEILNLPDEGDVGYQLMIVIPKQTKEFQDFWIDMPPIITHLAPDPERLSQWQKDRLSANYKPNEKLLGTFLEHKGYTIHYRLLKFLLQHGFKCTITRAIKFYQVPFIRGFVELGAMLRTMNPEAKQVWKLIMNSVYGKFLQSELKQSSCVTTSDIDLIRKRILSPFFKDLIQINDHIFTILMAKETVSFKSCRHIGAVILDESKLIMFKHYANVKTKFPGANLLYTDTDSHVWQFPKGVSRDMIYKELPFDHSGLPKENKYHNNDHKGELGYVKDEHPELTEIVALASKIYSLIDGGKTTNHAKGIPTRFVKNELTFDDYKEALHDKILDPVETLGFQSVNQVLTTVTKVKKNISSFDDKRYILDDGISTVPYGHYSLEESDVAKVNHQKVIEEKLKWYSTFRPTASATPDEPEKTVKGRSPELQAQINAKAARTRAIKKVDDAQKNFDADPSEDNRKALDTATENLEKAEENLEKASKVLTELKNKEEEEREEERLRGGILSNWRKDEDEEIVL